jgi:hypothetical protein
MGEVRKWDEGPIGEVEGNGTMRKWRLVTLITEVLVKIKPTDPLRLVEQEACRN